MNVLSRKAGPFATGLFRTFESVVNLTFGLLNQVMPGAKPKDQRHRRILLTRMDSIGDVILFGASLPAYRELFASDYIVLVVRQDAADVLANCPFVDEVWSINTRRFRTNLAERWRWSRRIRRTGFDIAINTVFSNYFPEFDWLVSWTGASRRVAHRCNDRYGARSRPWPHYTDLSPSGKGQKFEIDRNFDLLAYLGYRGSVQRIARIWTAPPTHRSGPNMRAARTVRPYAVVCPGARTKEKIWPVDNFARVVREVNQSIALHWIVCGHATEIDLCKSLFEGLDSSEISIENLAGMVSLGELTAIIGHAVLCLGNDSAPLHIAAAMGTPGVCVQGGGHFGRFYPYPDNPLTTTIFNVLPCYHCHWHCILNERECLTRIPVDSVVDTALRLLKAEKRDRAGVANAIT